MEHKIRTSQSITGQQSANLQTTMTDLMLLFYLIWIAIDTRVHNSIYLYHFYHILMVYYSDTCMSQLFQK